MLLAESEAVLSAAGLEAATGVAIPAVAEC
jgi:hypothetical protein